jgi:hypothetical protein
MPELETGLTTSESYADENKVDQYGQPEGHIKLLCKIRELYERMYMHPAYQEWKKQCRIGWDFYDGIQWTDEEKKEIESRGQAAIVINKLATPLDNLCGTEIQTRFKTSFRNRDLQNPAEAKLAEILTKLGMTIQEQTEATYWQSLKFQEHLVAGIGWGRYYLENGRFGYEQVMAEEMVFDANDRTPQLTSSRAVARRKWMLIVDAIERFPLHADRIRKYAGLKHSKGKMRKGEGMQPDIYGLPGYTSAHLKGDAVDNTPVYASADGDRVLVIEVQYRVPAKMWIVNTPEGRIISTFSKLDADKAAEGTGEEPIERMSSRVVCGYFTGDVLLEHGFLPVQPFNTNDFEYIPLVYQRRRRDGVPYGLIHRAIDAQKEANKRRSKALHLMNSQGVLIDSESATLNGGADNIRAEMTKPDMVLLYHKEGKLDFQRNMDLANGQMQMLQQSGFEIQQCLGVYDESVGRETNAVSGVAIQSRQVAGVKNHVRAFDNLRLMKKREATTLIGLMQAGFGENVLVEVLDNDEGALKQYILNEPYVDEETGKKVFRNDISTIQLDIFVDEMRDYDAPSQEATETITKYLQSPEGRAVLSEPDFARAIGIRQAETIERVMKKVFGKAQGQGGGSPAEGEAGTVNAATASAAPTPSIGGPTG